MTEHYYGKTGSMKKRYTTEDLISCLITIKITDDLFSLEYVSDGSEKRLARFGESYEKQGGDREDLTV